VVGRYWGIVRAVPRDHKEGVSKGCPLCFCSGHIFWAANRARGVTTTSCSTAMGARSTTAHGFAKT